MSSSSARSSRRTLLLAAGAVAIVSATPRTPWSSLAHDGEDHGATPGAATPDAAANDRHMTDGDSGVGGLYLTIANAGAEPDALLAGETTVCQTVEPHAMRLDGDVMVMTYLPDGLPIPAGGSVTLAPDGDHVMLVGLTQDLRPDTTFAISLTFRRAGVVQLTSSVRWVLSTDGAAPEGLADPVSVGDLTIGTVWSRPAPMISTVAEPIGSPATPASGH